MRTTGRGSSSGQEGQGQGQAAGAQEEGQTPQPSIRRTYDTAVPPGIEDLNLNPVVSVLLLFASLPDCIQNQTTVSDILPGYLGT